MCMSELLDCFLVAKLMIARGTPFEIGLIIRLESWLRNGRDHARTGKPGQSFFRENYLWRSCRGGSLNFKRSKDYRLRIGSRRCFDIVELASFNYLP